MSNHTPGDWRIEPCEGGYQIWDESGVACIATVHAGVLPDDTGLANAKLIAASPKMLEACKECLDYIGIPQRPAHLRPQWAKDMWAAIDLTT